MSDCLFCKIVRKQIPAEVVHEDEQVLAFKDISPRAPVHILLIPKAHCSGLNELTPDVQAAVPRLMEVAARLARELGVAESGWRLLSNCGADGGQAVFHLHFHLLGGRPLGGMVGRG
ncbi:MAG: histidine triad nucleotide-binding protein [Acidobacteria bacterium]|nr:histidine triad nucleotide-binding protein [Acidobacteriota bacterium]